VIDQLKELEKALHQTWVLRGCTLPSLLRILLLYYLGWNTRVEELIMLKP